MTTAHAKHTHTPSTRRVTRDAGFTLVELTIVIMILSILAAIVVPKVSQGSDQSRAAVAATTANAVQTKIFEHNAINGAFPAVIDPTWFVDKSLPVNPWDPAYAGSPIIYDNSAAATDTHPVFKFFRGNGVFWYNPKNGRFRALVPPQATLSATLEVYNQSNGVALNDLNATTGG